MKNLFKKNAVLRATWIAAIIVAMVFIITSCGDSSGGGTIAVTGITLNKTTISLEVGGTDTLTFNITPPKPTNNKVTWESNKPAVASVLQSGLVTAHSDGQAIITVTTKDGNHYATCAVTVATPVTSPGAELMTSADAVTYLSTLKLGVNIAGSFDAYPYDPSWNSNNYSETAWGNPVINQTLLNGIAAAGFDIVRLPITWIHFIGNAPDYTVSESRLRRIAEVVNMARNAGLKIIINTHHDDGSFNGIFWDCGWLRLDKAASNLETKKEITTKFQAVWRQIAQYFINYGDYLLFESFNELASASWTPEGNQTDIINEWNQVFVDAVRSTGGNNGKRFLILPGFAAKEEFTTNYFILPSDNGNSGTNKLIVAFHYYDPHEFTHESSANWGSAAAVDIKFKRLREYIRNDIPIILDEFGLKYNSSIENVQKDYLHCVVGTAHKYGMPALFWDNSDEYNFRLFNRATGRLFPYMESYVQTMKNALK